jgi:2-polyprenyl-3-methyl-5-hydroxy-6-metoxy-1,4-benzoquinol methylase
MSNNLKYYQANRGIMRSFLPEEYERVLEVGCGAGGFSDHLKRPCEVWGIEPNPDAAAAARSKMDKVLIGTYEAVANQLPDKYFDLVICNDVIEHMTDHDHFLENIKTKMREGGYIVGSIPNIRHVTSLFKILIAKDWPYSDSGILDRTHLRFFTAKSLRRTLLSHNYSVEAFSGLNSIIRNGISRNTNKPSALQNAVFKTVSLIVVVLSLGYYFDTQFPQYGFRVRYNPK